MIFTPILYLTGTVVFGSMFLSGGGENLIDAIEYGARWPLYIRYYFS